MPFLLRYVAPAPGNASPRATGVAAPTAARSGMTWISDDAPAQELVKADWGNIGKAAAAGATIGSIVPGVGTILGGAGGAAVEFGRQNLSGIKSVAGSLKDKAAGALLSIFG